MISDLHKYIFVHIPKCGGTSIEHALLQRETNFPYDVHTPFWIDNLNEATRDKFLLGKRDSWHMPQPHPGFNSYTNKRIDVCQHYMCSEFPEEKRKSYFKFTFVRNPWDKLVSEWLYFKKHESELFKGVKFRNCLGSYWKCIDRESKEMKYITTPANTSDLNIKERVEFPWVVHSIYQWKFAMGCDYIGKFENLQQDFDIICDKIGISRQQLPHVNKSKNRHKHYTEYYDDETREIVAEKYAKDIKCFGYEFGE